MATIGQQLLQPESGWKRYDNKNPLIQYNGNWFITHSDARFYQSGEYWGNDNLATIKFKIKSSRLRIIGYSDANRSQNFKITANGTTVYTGDYKASGIIQSMVADINLETSDIYIIEISSLDTKSIGLDAIDIDSDGKLLHPILEEKSKLEEMNIGDIISCEYTAASGTVGTFANLGNATKDVIPSTSIAAPNGSFYFVKVDKNLLVADRVVQHSITWDALNAGGYIEGRIIPLSERILPLNTSQSSGTDVQNGYTASKLFDNVTIPKNTNGWWTTSGKNINEWVDFEFNDLTDVSLLVIENGYSSHAVKDYKIQISNDGTNYTDIFKGTLLNIDGLQFINIPKSKIKFLRIFCTNSYGSYLTLSEVYIYSAHSLIRSLSGGSAYIDYLKKKEVALHLPLLSDIVDKSPIPRSVTITGGAIMPVVQEGAGKFGNNSLYFNGTNNTLTLPNNVCNFGTRDFTIDFWVKLPPAAIDAYSTIIGNTNSTIWNAIYISDHMQGQKISIVNNSNGARALVSTKRVDDNNYHHIVIQRRNGVLQIFIDGILDVFISYSVSINWNISTNVFVGSNGVAAQSFLKGYINDLRIIKGTGIYEGNFTPPTGLLPKQVSELDIPVMSTTNQALGGFPNTNEWDKYIVNSDLEGKITPGDNNIWNYVIGSWSNETAMLGVVSAGGNATTSAWRMIRGYIDSYGGLERVTFGATSTISTTTGFRPVLQLKHDNQSNVWG